jgi:hypothetical protein
VSVAVRQHIVENFSIDPATIDDSIEGAVKDKIEDSGDQVEKASEAERVAAEVFADANVTVSVVDLKQQSNHPVLALLESSDLERLPLCVLVSPDGRALLLPWDLSIDTSDTDLRELLTSIVDSPRRAEIVQNVLTAHSAILLVNGEDASANISIIQAVDSAVQHVHDSLRLLPKPIAYPPLVIAMEPAETDKEKILLWSLGVEPPGRHEARVVVLLGRCRIIGPPVTFPSAEAQQQLLTNLTAVGQDCECGLDRSWMQGEMIPHVWSDGREASAMKELAFDPGDPLVKAEISRILQRGLGARQLQEQNLRQPESGYREIALDEALEQPVDDKPAFDIVAPTALEIEQPSNEAADVTVADETDPTVETANTVETVRKGGDDPSAVTVEPIAPKSDPDVSTAAESPSRVILLALSVVGLVALIGAGIVLLRARRGATA